MITLIVLLSFNLCLSAPRAGSPYLEPIYYWREYDNGHVPSDAIPGGLDQYGRTTYIGGTIMTNGNGLIPANIYPGIHTTAEYNNGTYRLAHSHTKHLQILCSPCIHTLRWVETHKDYLDKVNGTIVRAGKERHWEMFVGRGYVNNELIVGKIIRTPVDLRGVRLPLNLKTGTSIFLDKFEVLVF